MNEKKRVNLKKMRLSLGGTLTPRSEIPPPDISSKVAEPNITAADSSQLTNHEASMDKSDKKQIVIRGGAMIPKSELAPAPAPESTSPAPPDTAGVIIPANPQPPPPPPGNSGNDE